jgi:hypothetical protein
VTFRDERGRELFDVPDAPVVDGDVVVPVRFLPEYDNVLLSHEDRTRVVDRWLIDPVFTRGSLLVDGFVNGGWSLKRTKRAVTLTLEVFDELSGAVRAEVEAEGETLLRFLAPTAETRTLEVTRVEP